MSRIEYFTGRVRTVIYENPQASFYILKIKLDDDPDADNYDPLATHSVITVKGNIPGVTVGPGVWFGFEGHWVTHKEHGRQVEITRAPIIKGDWTPSRIEQTLSAHGVGRFTVQALYAHFGDDLVAALGDAERLQEVDNIDKYAAEHIASRWRTVQALFRTVSFLNDLDLPQRQIDKIWSTFGDEAERIMATDPWALVKVDGIDFATADEVAQRLGLPLDTPLRVKGAILHVMRKRRMEGHLFAMTGTLKADVEGYVGAVQAELLAQALKLARNEGLLVIDRKTREGMIAVYEPWFYDIEDKSALLLLERFIKARFRGDAVLSYTSRLGNVGPATQAYVKDHPDDIKGAAKCALEEWTRNSKTHLESRQMEAAINALTEPVSVLKGLPGTGKTFTLKTVVKVLQDAEVPFLLVAPTGIAAKRVMSVTGAEASTIHRAFQAQGMDMTDEREATYAGIVGTREKGASASGHQEQWGFSPEQPHPAEVIVVDESSMVDQHLLYRILSCTAPHCRVVLVGDAAQLPSVGPGNVLRDLIECNLFPVTGLTEIYRQQDTSDIVLAAHAINNGLVPRPTEGKNDFAMLEMVSEDEVLEALLGTVQKLYARHANFQVLSPRHGGTLGVTNLNNRIRQLLNPQMRGLQEMRLGKETIREGDRIMVVKNNYQFEIFNGDVGKVVRLDRKEKLVEIKIWGPPEVLVQLPMKEAAGLLRLAYAITVHKSQGQEYDVILAPWVKGFRHQLQRNLIYTAITRARKKVLLFGHQAALAEAVLNSEVMNRNTLLPYRIAGYAKELLDGLKQHESGVVPDGQEDEQRQG